MGDGVKIIMDTITSLYPHQIVHLDAFESAIMREPAITSCCEYHISTLHLGLYQHFHLI